MQTLFKFIKKISYFVPFTIYVAVFCALIIPGYLWLGRLGTLPDSAYRDIVSLLLSIALLFSVAILCFGLITVLVSYIYFKLRLGKDQVSFALHTTVDHNRPTVNLRLSPVLLPLLGFLRIRIFYDGLHYSRKFSPVTKRSNMFQLSFEGSFSWDLPEIREYRIEKAIVYFEDFFQFFSFATTVHAVNRFHIVPAARDLDKLNASPRKTEETTTRIDELKRVEGELINYKHFENNDDVRRIVWKIYAKNKEFVVRIPEIMDPYASHMYLYTSFYSAFNTEGNSTVEQAFLSYYKTVCWSVYMQLTQKGFEVKHITDQPVPPGHQPEAAEQVKYAITVSGWQRQANLRDFIRPGYASVVVISSLSDLEQVKEFADHYGSDISMVYVPLTDALEGNDIKDWIKWLFVENEQGKTTSDKARWNVSPLRLKIRENERAIAGVMKQTQRSTVI